MKKPFERDVLVGSIGQRPTNGDGKYSGFELLEGNVNGV